MFTYKTLVLGVVGVALIMGGAYAVLQTEGDLSYEASTDTRIADEDEERVLDDVGYEEEGEDEDADSEQGEDVREEEEESSSSQGEMVKVPPHNTVGAQTTPSPAPTPVVTPTPAPTPAPTPVPTAKPEGYTASDVKLHASAASCWSIIEDSVYDLTSFVKKHPGGEKKILRICGTDGTSAFQNEHGGDSKPESMLARYRLGAYLN